ncbi:hypothetical protein [Kribbella sp. NPDC006257]|uniref:hypothetical protein n=1 Tax=Kribbella sp. NPDC006257 TaxID=3156738 RepID=UPI0033B29897
MPGSWFAEATGKTGLKSSVEVKEGAKTLPFQWDAQHPFVYSSIQCRVTAGDDVVVEFTAEMKQSAAVEYVKNAVDKAPADTQFKAAGGLGSVDVTEPPTKVVYTYWYCGSSVLDLTLRKFASDDKVGLAKQLAQRIAERVGCTQLFTAPTPTPSN